MKDIRGKIVWITGASSGLGEALVYEFAHRGAKLILSARRQEQLKSVGSNIQNAFILPLDLSERSEFANKTKEALLAYGRIDMIVHCGGIAQNGLAVETTSEVQRKIMDIDFFSYTELSQCILPHFIERQSGHIVVVSGVLAKIGMPGRSSYSAAKAALHGYFNCLRTELVNDNINVTIVVPGSLNTALTSKALNGHGEISGMPSLNKGCSVKQAAKQAVKAIVKCKYEPYIGNNDKSRLLLWLSRLFPSKAVNILLKQAKKNK